MPPASPLDPGIENNIFLLYGVSNVKENVLNGFGKFCKSFGNIFLEKFVRTMES